MIDEFEIESPISDKINTSIDTLFGTPIPPLIRLETFDEDTWEDVTLELVSQWKKEYSKVVRCGGGGDMGRDVIAYTPNGDWENFQCKHYANPITLDEAISEIGKLIYYAYSGFYQLPIKYYFVAPKGIQNKLLNCLMDTENLKKELINKWDKHCRTKITKTRNIDLDSALQSYINNSVDFKVFDHIAPLDIIKLHSKTQYHAIRFGAVTYKRPQPTPPPPTLEDSELLYTAELLSAFSDEAGINITVLNLPDYSEYDTEYASARKNYYYADGLDQFSRDWLPTGSYKDLLEECYEALSPVVNNTHKNGYIRYLEVSSQAVQIDYSSHPLSHYIKIQDKKGFCHHLVNKKRIKWVKK